MAPLSAVKVDQGDHRGQLQLGVWVGDMDPHDLVPVQELALGSGASIEHVGEVRLVAGAVPAQDLICDRQVEGMDEDLGGKDRRLG